MNQEITVEQGYYIALIFFNLLCPQIEPNAKESSEMESVHTLFFYEICSGEESSTEWKEAVCSVTNKKENQLVNEKLIEKSLFFCVISFCKLFNNRWGGHLSYTLNLLEEMQSRPNDHINEWHLWKQAKEDVLIKGMHCGTFYF